MVKLVLLAGIGAVLGGMFLGKLGAAGGAAAGAWFGSR